MLVNVTKNHEECKFNTEQVLKEYKFTEEEKIDMIEQFSYTFEGDDKLDDGVFINYCSFNEPLYTNEKLECLEYDYEKSKDYNILALYSSGLCDNYQQVLDKRSIFVDLEEKYVLFLTPIDHNDGDFNMGKWGDYIGDNYQNQEIIFFFQFFKVV